MSEQGKFLLIFRHSLRQKTEWVDLLTKTFLWILQDCQKRISAIGKIDIIWDCFTTLISFCTNKQRIANQKLDSRIVIYGWFLDNLYPVHIIVIKLSYLNVVIIHSLSHYTVVCVTLQTEQVYTINSFSQKLLKYF